MNIAILYLIQLIKYLSYCDNMLYQLSHIVFFDSSMMNSSRLKKELSQLHDKPPVGIKINLKEESISSVEAGKNCIYF